MARLFIWGSYIWLDDENACAKEGFVLSDSMMWGLEVCTDERECKSSSTENLETTKSLIVDLGLKFT